MNSKSCRYLAGLVLGVLAVMPVAAQAREGGSAAVAAPETHDGFYLRLAAGPGMSLGQSVQIANTSVAVGWAVRENLIVQLDISGVKSIAAGADAGTDVLNVGVGAVYYLMPANLYFAGSAGVSNQFDPDYYYRRTTAGWAANFLLGKEWWVSENWGIGIAGQFMYSSVPEMYVDSVGGWRDSYKHSNLKFFGLHLSATYN